MKRIMMLCLVSLLVIASKCDNEPLEGEFLTEQESASCEIAIQNVINAGIAFEAATENTYEQLCIAYKTAIQFQIEFCGDPDGSLQALLDSIGACSTNTNIEDCSSAQEAVDLAQAAFEAATPENYTDLCIIYREALLTLIELCGPDGETQAKLVELGNCIQDTLAEGILTVTAGNTPLVFDLINVFQSGNSLNVAAQTGSPAYYIVYFKINLGETGTDIINDTFKINVISQYLPSTQGFDDFTSTITTNTPGNIIGTFNGHVTNADGEDLSLTSGVISVSY